MNTSKIIGAAVFAAVAIGGADRATADTTSRFDRDSSSPMHATEMQIAHADHATIGIEGAYVQQSIGKSGTSGGYMTLHNHGKQDDRLLGVRTPVAGKAQIHQTSIGANGVATMRPVDAVEVPAGGMAELKPGGLHMMLMQLNHALEPGMDVPLTLIFEKAGEVTITVRVMAIGKGGANHGNMNMDHGHMSHGTMDAGAPDGGQ